MDTKDEALKMAYDWVNEYAPPEVVQAYKEALEQEERTQRTMYCGTADAFIAMDDDHKRRWFVQSLRESKRRKELEDILEQPAQEPVAWMLDDGKTFETEKNDYHERYEWSPLYTHPAPSWQGLSDDEINKIVQTVSDDMYPWKGNMLIGKIIRAIEQALKEKNNG